MVVAKDDSDSFGPLLFSFAVCLIIFIACANTTRVDVEHIETRVEQVIETENAVVVEYDGDLYS